MKNRKIKNTLYAICLLASVSLVGCSDWTEVEGLNVNQPTIETQNPELYAKYLESIRVYKSSSHKCTYVWFDNSSKVPSNRARHLITVPDSVDVIVLMHPDKLIDRELQEMDQVRATRGTKVIYSLNYDEIKLAFDSRIKAKSVAEGDEDLFLKYLNDTVSYVLSLADKYKYDGIIAGFKGKSTDHMTEGQIKVYKAYESAFFGAVKEWYEKHSDKMLVFEGMPQYLSDKDFLKGCKHIIIPCKDVDNNALLSYRILMAKAEGVPADRFVVSVQTNSLDPRDSKTGIWSDGKTRSITAAAFWVAAAKDPSIAGMGIYNVSNDYFNSELIFKYKYTREAISILNPSIKK